MTDRVTPRLSSDDDLALDAASDERLEFWSGEVVAMAGGTMDHALLQVGCTVALRAALRAAGRPCRVLSADAKVWLADGDMTVYPDLSVICGPIVRPAHDANTATNPNQSADFPTLRLGLTARV